MPDSKLAAKSVSIPERAREIARECKKKLPKCLSYPECDGDLVGTEHEEKCPMRGQEFMTMLEFATMCAKAALLSERELCLREVQHDVNQFLETSAKLLRDGGK